MRGGRSASLGLLPCEDEEGEGRKGDYQVRVLKFAGADQAGAEKTKNQEISGEIPIRWRQSFQCWISDGKTRPRD